MPGTILSLLPKTTFSFGGNVLAANALQEIPIALNVDTLPWTSGTILLRIHDAPTWSTGAEATAALYASAPTSDDPAKVFRALTPLGSVNAKQADNIGAPFLKTGTISALAGTADLLISFKQATSSVQYTLTISVDVALKTA